jgi:hypothetical protein
MADKYRLTWGTTDEIKYLKDIGHHQMRRSLMSRQFWLRRYRGIMPLRKVWGDISRPEIEQYLNEAIIPW